MQFEDIAENGGSLTKADRRHTTEGHHSIASQPYIAIKQQITQQRKHTSSMSNGTNTYLRRPR
jgi:hypothetical protein